MKYYHQAFMRADMKKFVKNEEKEEEEKFSFMIFPRVSLSTMLFNATHNTFRENSILLKLTRGNSRMKGTEGERFEIRSFMMKSHLKSHLQDSNKQTKIFWASDP